ncbi:MAG: hypothetical protein ABFS18_08075 [Thermodesulfobacteriota bacterium]
MEKAQQKLKVKGQKWLRTFHIYLGCLWGGGASSLFALHCLYNPDYGPELYARNMALIYIDNYILVPSAIGSMLTGFLYCQLTRWGYLRYYWVIVKWAATGLFILTGFLWFIPWLDRMAETSLVMRNLTAVDPTYSAKMYIHMAMAAGQAILVFSMVIISVFKPWGRTGIKW